MQDWERLKLVKRTLEQLETIGRKGTFFIFLSLLGKILETEVGKVLGLTFGDKTKGTVKPL